VGEGERVAPEEPLKRYHAYRHTRQPDEGECGLAACEARVEEANARNHKKDKSCGCEHPGDISRLGESATAKLAEARDGNKPHSRY
jgi:hypothetical protein